MLKIAITSAITLCAFAVGMALIYLQGSAMNKLQRLEHENISLRKELNDLVLENDTLFKEHVDIERRIDSLIYSDTPQDSILMKLYNIRHRE
jgi:hypothetical protein